MKIESVDFFYCSMPEVLDIGDGSQDALLVRVRAGGFEGWGECEASPLPSIASYVCPMSHSACKPVKYAVEGRELNDVSDIVKINQLAQEHSFDLLQASHTLSGIDIALWDLLGKKEGAPVYQLLGYKDSFGKVPYASQLFGDDAQQTFTKATQARQRGFRAIKFGWGPFGRTDVQDDLSQLEAARAGAGSDILLMIDAGTVWGDDVERASLRLEALKKIGAYWLEEPFLNLAVDAYHGLSKAEPVIALAGGEGCNNFEQASLMISHAGLGFIQIDAGRIGGITVAKKVAELARSRQVRYVNHTFTSHLALSASLQPYAGLEQDHISEYPVELKALARDLTKNQIVPDKDGLIWAPEAPGLGMEINLDTVRRYLQDIDIRINGKRIFYSPTV
jgi:L-alanine-DL-glutamate epimerase-like enolase superfamily enzyme